MIHTCLFCGRPDITLTGMCAACEAEREEQERSALRQSYGTPGRLRKMSRWYRVRAFRVGRDGFGHPTWMRLARLCEEAADDLEGLVRDENGHVVAHMDGKRPVFGSGTP